MACAFVLKRFDANFGHVDDSEQLGFDGTVYEISLVTLSAYLAYLIAEVMLCPLNELLWAKHVLCRQAPSCRTPLPALIKLSWGRYRAHGLS